jgi:hypothetical protein
MILDAGYAWITQEVDILMLDAVPAKRQVASEGFQVGGHPWHQPRLTG